MMMPATADLSIVNPSCDSPYQGANAGYHSRILKETEIACPGYYSVFLYDHKVEAELSATAHCGVQRYTFPEEEESRILIDLLFPSEYGFNVKDAKITKVDNSNKGFIEGNSWQYSWYVPHDVPGLVALVGEDEFNARLETGFEKSQKHKFAAHFFDRTTGQSAEFYINHGNEVNMCTPYLFNYSGKPWRRRNGAEPFWSHFMDVLLIMDGRAMKMRGR